MVTDEQVFKALSAAQDEGKCWRIIEFAGGRGAIAVRDLEQSSTGARLAPLSEAAVAFEKLEFSDPNDARQYVDWRSVKAALECYAREKNDGE